MREPRVSKMVCKTGKEDLVMSPVSYSLVDSCSHTTSSPVPVKPDRLYLALLSIT